MVTLQEMALYLNELLQVSQFNDYCKNGLQVEGSPKISKIATAVSSTLDAIEKAAEMQADLLLVHHGLFWSGDSHEIVGIKKKKLELLLKHNISLMAFHLPLDAHREFGNNWRAASEMSFMDIEPFGFFNGREIGVKGRVKRQTKEEFQKKLENYYGQKAHVALGGKEIVETVGLISGGAYKSIQEALSNNLDCFVTGNFDEPVWNVAFEEKINFYALGHTATEKIGPKAIGEHLKSVFKIEVHFIETKNPF